MQLVTRNYYHWKVLGVTTTGLRIWVVSPFKKKKEKKKKKKKKERLPPKIILSYRTLLSIVETGMTTNLDTFFKGLWVAAFRSTMCILRSTSTAWKESKWTGQYECKPRRALGGIRNSWTEAGNASRDACNSDLQNEYCIHQVDFKMNSYSD